MIRFGEYEKKKRMICKCLDWVTGQRYLALEVENKRGGTGLIAKTMSLVKFERHMDH